MIDLILNLYIKFSYFSLFYHYRHDDRARKAKQKQRFYIKHDPIPINKHPFKLYRLITYACEYKDLGPSRNVSFFRPQNVINSQNFKLIICSYLYHS